MVGSWKNSAIALAAITLLALPSAALAKDKMQFGVSGFGGFNTYTMTDLNDEIKLFNSDLAGSGVSLDEVKHGLGLGGGVCAWVTKDILVSAEYQRLFAKTSTSGSISGIPYSFEFKLPANAISVSGGYYFPSPSKVRFGLGAGVGYYWTKTSITAEVNGVSLSDSVSTEFKGHGLGFHGVGLLDVAATPQVHLGVQIGYRYAKTTELKDADGNVIYKVDATGTDTTTKAKADWNGLVARGGVTFLFGTSE
jgi:hypothetical protein